MGWFWTSTTSSSSASGMGTSPNTTTPTSAPRSTREPASSGDHEVQKFWEMLQQETQSEPRPQVALSNPPATPPPTSKSSSSSSWLPWGRSSEPTPAQTQSQPEARIPTSRPRGRSPESLAMSEAQLPTTMSCRDAFDYAWHCHTPGAQWNAVYRYGGVRSCSELWDDFWFCMRTKNYGPEARAEAIRAHYRAKEEAKYGGGQPSSEDVWESRKEMVPPGTAFRGTFGAPIQNDQEYRKIDAERRRRIREELGTDSGRQ